MIGKLVCSIAHYASYYSTHFLLQVNSGIETNDTFHDVSSAALNKGIFQYCIIIASIESEMIINAVDIFLSTEIETVNTPDDGSVEVVNNDREPEFIY